MALRPEEILRIKWELGVSVTLLGAEPYITYLAIFDQAIQPFIIDPTTTSSTTVSASSTGQQVILTLAAIPVIAGTSIPAFSVGSNVSIDTNPNFEEAQIQAISGSTITVTLFLAHSGAYPVTMAGGEQVVRDILTRLEAIRVQLTSVAPLSAGVEQLDRGEIKLYPSTPQGSRRGSRDMFEALVRQRETARDDLGEAVGFRNLRSYRREGGMASVPF